MHSERDTPRTARDERSSASTRPESTHVTADDTETTRALEECEQLLDEALIFTFPASDPISIRSIAKRQASATGSAEVPPREPRNRPR